MKQENNIMIKENHTAKIYHIRNNHEYGKFILFYQDNYLEIICHTTYGTYGHIWSSQGKNAYEFMLKMSFNTFVEKMSEGRHLIVDNDKQEELMIKKVIEIGKENNWSEKEIEYQKSLVQEICHCGYVNSEEFRMLICASELFENIYNEDYEDIEVEEMINPHLESLWNELWVPLINKIKEESLIEK